MKVIYSVHFNIACVIKAGEIGSVFIDTETYSTGVTRMHSMLRLYRILKMYGSEVIS